MTVYHGTDNDFTEWNTEEFNKRNNWTNRLETLDNTLFFTNSIEEAKGYGSIIKTAEISTSLYTCDYEIDGDELYSDWLYDLSDDDREYEDSTKQAQQNGKQLELLIQDAIDRHYKGIIIENIPGECGDTVKYIVVFDTTILK